MYYFEGLSVPLCRIESNILRDTGYHRQELSIAFQGMEKERTVLRQNGI